MAHYSSKTPVGGTSTHDSPTKINTHFENNKSSPTASIKNTTRAAESLDDESSSLYSFSFSATRSSRYTNALFNDTIESENKCPQLSFLGELKNKSTHDDLLYTPSLSRHSNTNQLFLPIDFDEDGGRDTKEALIYEGNEIDIHHFSSNPLPKLRQSEGSQTYQLRTNYKLLDRSPNPYLKSRSDTRNFLQISDTKHKSKLFESNSTNTTALARSPRKAIFSSPTYPSHIANANLRLTISSRDTDNISIDEAFLTSEADPYADKYPMTIQQSQARVYAFNEPTDDKNDDDIFKIVNSSSAPTRYSTTSKKSKNFDNYQTDFKLKGHNSSSFKAKVFERMASNLDGDHNRCTSCKNSNSDDNKERLPSKNRVALKELSTNTLSNPVTLIQSQKFRGLSLLDKNEFDNHRSDDRHDESLAKKYSNKYSKLIKQESLSTSETLKPDEKPLRSLNEMYKEETKQVFSVNKAHKIDGDAFRKVGEGRTRSKRLLVEAQLPSPIEKKRSLGPRSRIGCWTCRIRHKACPEERPVCSLCRRLGLDCDYSEEKPIYMTNKIEQVAKLKEIKDITTTLKRARRHHFRKKNILVCEESCTIETESSSVNE